MKSSSWQFLDLKKLIPLVGLSIFQQLLTVFGTYALLKAGFSIQSGTPLFLWVSLALLAHLIAPMFSYLVRPLETRLTFSAYKNFLSEKLLSKAANPSIWAQKDRRETFLASIGSEADSYLGAIIFVGLDVFSYVLSLILGVLVLGFALDMTFIPAFLVSGVLSYLIYFVLQKKVVQKSQEEQEARTHLAGFLLHSWENIFFKNSEIIKSYSKGFDDVFTKAESGAVLSTRWSEGLIGLLSMASSLPVFAAIFWIAFKNHADVASLTALLVTIPRQLNLLGVFRSLFQATTSFISFESKFKTLIKNSTLEAENLHERISFSELGVDGFAKDLLTEIKSAQQGRLTIRGRNGAGKSTLLLYLNETMENSFYLPSHPQFLRSEGHQHESTGQKLMRHLHHISQSDAKYILMDEWDANLDDQNILKVDALIASLSKTKVVVEVRHRRS
jgi:ABC-type multidrug transport system fused ATPase/permease subunit